MSKYEGIDKIQNMKYIKTPVPEFEHTLTAHMNLRYVPIPSVACRWFDNESESYLLSW